MSWHFGIDYDMWLYPPVDYTAPDYDFELPEPIEAANIEGTLLVNAEDAIEQVRRLQAENAKLQASNEVIAEDHAALCEQNEKLRELVELMYGCSKGPDCDDCKRLNDGYACAYIMRELGIEVDE